MNLRPLAAAALLVLVTGCGITPPGSTPSASAPPSPSVAPTSAPATPTAPATTASAQPTPSASPSVTALVLGGVALGKFAVGSPESAVVADLTARLGKPTDSDQGPLCSLDSGSRYSRILLYGPMWAQFVAADAKKASPRTLFNWGTIVERGLPKGVVMQDGVPLNLNWKQLKAKYPAAKAVETGAEGTQALQLPNKLLFTGDDIPLQVQGGQFTACE
jgi:hypothetical protein